MSSESYAAVKAHHMVLLRSSNADKHLTHISANQLSRHTGLKSYLRRGVFLASQGDDQHALTLVGTIPLIFNAHTWCIGNFENEMSNHMTSESGG